MKEEAIRNKSIPHVYIYIYIYIYIFIYININELQLSSCSELTCFSTVWVERKSWLNQWNKRENSERDDIGRQERDPGIDGFHRQFCFHHFQLLHLCINYFRFSFLKKIYIYIRNVSWENRKIDGGRWTDYTFGHPRWASHVTNQILPYPLFILLLSLFIFVFTFSPLFLFTRPPAGLLPSILSSITSFKSRSPMGPSCAYRIISSIHFKSS